MIAVLEDDERRTAAMREELSQLFPEVESVFFDNAPDMVAWLRDNLQGVCLLCLDHDLGPDHERDGRTFDPGIGRDVVDFLITQEPRCPVLIHSSNTEAACDMRFALDDAGWFAERMAPSDDLAWIKAEWSGRVAALWEWGAA